MNAPVNRPFRVLFSTIGGHTGRIPGWAKLSALVLGSAIGIFASLALAKHHPSEIVWLPPCAFHAWTGFYCPGCGSSRALHALAHGEFFQALSHNALLIAALILIPMAFIGELVSRRYATTVRGGAFAVILRILSWHRYSSAPRLVMAILLLWTLLRNIPAYPFTILAP